MWHFRFSSLSTYFHLWPDREIRSNGDTEVPSYNTRIIQEHELTEHSQLKHSIHSLTIRQIHAISHLFQGNYLREEVITEIRRVWAWAPSMRPWCQAAHFCRELYLMQSLGQILAMVTTSTYKFDTNQFILYLTLLPVQDIPKTLLTHTITMAQGLL